jgi:hypothetical protein
MQVIRVRGVTEVIGIGRVATAAFRCLAWAKPGGPEANLEYSIYCASAPFESGFVAFGQRDLPVTRQK